jgi:catechol 2,3-dioxygenase-like lactoylglutathione lyase family enzyme
MRLELQHVSIPVPPGRRSEAREFYNGLLGLDERDVPPKLDPAQLIWFRVGGDLELHLFESDEPAPRSQHFCLRVDSGLDELRRRLEDAGVETKDTDEIIGRPRFFCRDPFGNRVELTEWRDA